MHREYVGQLGEGDLQSAFPRQAEVHGRATVASLYASWFCLQTRFRAQRPEQSAT